MRGSLRIPYCLLCFCALPLLLALAEEPLRFNFTRSRYSLRYRLSTTPTTDSPLSANDEIDLISIEATTSAVSHEVKSESDEISHTTESEAINSSALSTVETSHLPTTTLIPVESEKLLPEGENDSLQNACGVRSNDDFPWIAVLEHTNPHVRSRKQRKTLSKGVLITRQHVLTTVSSIHNSNPFWVVSRIRLGDTPTWGDENILHNRSSAVSIDVEEIYQHERKDIAIIKLAKAVNVGSSVLPICLPDHNNYNFRELQLHLCKRHSMYSVSNSPHVYSVPVTPLSPQDCTIMFQRKRAHYTLDEFCAWDETGDTCTGDLGGPLVVEVNGRFELIGLSSYISSKEKFNADDYPGIYTRVGAHLKWINAVLNL